MFQFFQTPAWQLIAQSDWMSKGILFSRLGLSVLCCAVVINKFMALREQRNRLKSFYQLVKPLRTFDELLIVIRQNHENLGADVVNAALNELNGILKNEKGEIQSGAHRSFSHGMLTEGETERLVMISEHTVETAVHSCEDQLPFLAVSAAVSPLVGLFGTVWGLIHAFINISQEKSADIAVVAPGIAEALITTLGGLVVAIPALVFFHYFSNEILKMENELLSTAEITLMIIKRTFNERKV